MKAAETRKVIDNLRQCTERQIQNKCSRNCKKCDLLMPCNEVLEGLETAIKVIDFVDKNRNSYNRKEANP